VADAPDDLRGVAVGIERDLDEVIPPAICSETQPIGRREHRKWIPLGLERVCNLPSQRDRDIVQERFVRPLGLGGALALLLRTFACGSNGALHAPANL
jgi:hypothetical protein